MPNYEGEIKEKADQEIKEILEMVIARQHTYNNSINTR